MAITTPTRRLGVTKRGDKGCFRPLLILALVALAACSGQDESEDDTGTDATTRATTTAVATTEAVSSSDEVVAIFDGATCTYQGPERVTPTAAVTVTFTNESDVRAELFVTSVRSEHVEEVLSLIGGEAVGPDLEITPSAIALEMASDPGESTTRIVMLAPGTWIVDCHTLGGAQLWFVGVLDSS